MIRQIERIENRENDYRLTGLFALLNKAGNPRPITTLRRLRI